MSDCAMELPRYVCHKVVHALKIKAIEPLLPLSCVHPYGHTTCGYGPNDCMHVGSDSETVPWQGRHAYTPGQQWPYGLTDQALITPEEDGYAPFPVDAAYIRKHQPQVSGYFVVYEDGYKSFSPAAAFESGYTKI